MTTADDTFTPDWPHGHEMVDAIGAVHRFNVKAIDWPGPFPIVGHLQNESYVWKFTADGMREARAGSSLRLRNAPAPKPKPREWWVTFWFDGCPVLHSSEDACQSYQKRFLPAKPHEVIHVREVIEPEGGA